MLPQKNRVKKKKDFEIIFKNSKSFKNVAQGVPFIFKISQNSFNFSRFGFVVSQKISKKAAVRNKVRRRLTEAIKREIKNIKIGVDLIIIALPGIEKTEFADILKAINTTLNKSKLTII